MAAVNNNLPHLFRTGHATAESASTCAAELIRKQYQQLCQEIVAHCDSLQRTPPKLLVVTKTRTVADIAPLLLENNQTHPKNSPASGLWANNFGENYVSEALPKIAHFRNLGASIEWHYIGPIQSRACRDIAENFDWVQSLDRLKVALKLNQYARAPLQVLIQVNISAEESKSGIFPSWSGLQYFMHQLSPLTQLQVRGLMVIPHPQDTEAFARTRELFDRGRSQYGWDTLSMGMSGDFLDAITHGSTMIRLGTRVFQTS